MFTSHGLHSTHNLHRSRMMCTDISRTMLMLHLTDDGSTSPTMWTTPHGRSSLNISRTIFTAHGRSEHTAHGRSEHTAHGRWKHLTDDLNIQLTDDVRKQLTDHDSSRTIYVTAHGRSAFDSSRTIFTSNGRSRYRTDDVGYSSRTILFEHLTDDLLVRTDDIARTI